MAVTVKRSFLQSDVPQFYVKDGGIVRLLTPISVCLELQKKSRVYAVELLFKKGYESDGLSRPEFIGGWIKRFDFINMLYNFAGFVHDWLYSRKGVIEKDFVLARSECDDVFRGILRDAGVSRFKAGVMDWCVGVFAGGSKHWGNDSFGCCDKVVCSKLICIDGR